MRGQFRDIAPSLGPSAFLVGVHGSLEGLYGSAYAYKESYTRRQQNRRLKGSEPSEGTPSCNELEEFLNWIS